MAHRFALIAAIMAALLLLSADVPARTPASALLLSLGRDPRVVLADRVLAQPREVQQDLVCTALAVYHEARGSTPEDQLGVALVARNRVQASGASYCQVVFAPWQFSWTEFTVARLVPLDREAWARAQQVAVAVVLDDAQDITKGADHFYNPHTVSPSWGRGVKGLMLGAHKYLRLGG